MVGVRTVRVYLKIIIFDCILNEKDPSAITLRFFFMDFQKFSKGQMNAQYMFCVIVVIASQFIYSAIYYI